MGGLWTDHGQRTNIKIGSLVVNEETSVSAFAEVPKKKRAVEEKDSWTGKKLDWGM